MDTLAKSVDAILKLFIQASEELKFEEKERILMNGEDSVNEKLDRILDHNKAIAEGMIAISEMIQDLGGKPRRPIPNPIKQEPIFHPPRPEPNFNVPPMSEPNFDMPPAPERQFDMPPGPKQQGPVAMPSMTLSDIEKSIKPKKKGLFGRLKK